MEEEFKAMSIRVKRLEARSGSMECPICLGRKLLICHHIHGREIIGKNRQWNLCWICSACHDEIHSGKIIIEGWIQTSEGKKLFFRGKEEASIAKEGAKPPLYSK